MIGPTIDDLIGAQGKFVVFVAAVLQRAGVAPMGELADLLTAFAASIEETDQEEGHLLAQWAEAIRAARLH